MQKTLSAICATYIAIAMLLAAGVVSAAQAPAGSKLAGDGMCSVTVNVPPPSGPPPDFGQMFGRPDPKAALPKLVKVKGDVYVIQNTKNVLSEILQFGGNATAYITNDGVILVDSKVDELHDDIVAKIKTLTDKPIKYVVLTHSHGDHSGGVAKMVRAGATVIVSRDDRRYMARDAGDAALPQITYSRYGNVFLGGKEVQLFEYCGHTSGDTVAYFPAARVVVAGDLVTTPDSIPTIVSYADGGNWTDLAKALDSIATLDFDVLIGGHGPVLSKPEFLKYRDKVAKIGARAKELVKAGKSQQEISQTLGKELNWGSGPSSMVITGMMVEFR
jgi:glyoxylase-like metal-dependent hydrolase (beta-lactamase superfamily II)